MTKPDFASPEYHAALAGALRWDSERQEPYLQLPSFPDLRLVPFREDAAEEIKVLFNHHEIGKRLFTLPYPMSLEWAQGMVQRVRTQYAEPLAYLSTLPHPSTSSEPILPPADAEPLLFMPFKSLYSTTEGRIVGDMNLAIMDHAPNEPRPVEELKALPPSEQNWVFGYVIEPAQHGRGIGSEIVATVLEGWAVPWMKIGKASAWIEMDNPQSQAVLRKNGFEMVHSEMSKWPEDKGGREAMSGYWEKRL